MPANDLVETFSFLSCYSVQTAPKYKFAYSETYIALYSGRNLSSVRNEVNRMGGIQCNTRGQTERSVRYGDKRLRGWQGPRPSPHWRLVQARLCCLAASPRHRPIR